MRLSLKIASAMTLLTALAVLILGFISVSREAALLETDIERDARLVAEGISDVLELGLLANPEAKTPDEALHAIDRSTGDVRVMWLPSSELVPPTADERDLAELSGGTTLIRRDEQGYVALAPVLYASGLQGVVSVRESMTVRDAYIGRAIATNGITLLVVMVLCGGSSLVLGRWLVGSRVDRLVERAHLIASGAHVAEEPVVGRDELSMLVRAHNHMARELEERRERASQDAEARLQAEQQLRHADRLTTVGQLAAGMAHELGTPLNVISGRAALIVSRGSDQEDGMDAGIIRDQSARITRIVKRMLDFSRRSLPSRTSTDVRSVVSETADMLEVVARSSDVRVVLDLPDGPATAWVDAGQLQQVLANLMMNAIQAMPDGGQLQTSLEVLGGPDEGTDRSVRIVVADTGVGMPSEVAARIFDPFFTTKEPGEGTGLGLSVVHGIVADHGGTVTVDTDRAQGSAFIVELPGGRPT